MKKSKKTISLAEAKQMFFRCEGSIMGIDRDFGDAYRKCRVPKELENQWREELINSYKEKIPDLSGQKQTNTVMALSNLLEPDEGTQYLVAFLKTTELDSFSRLVLCEWLKDLLQRVKGDQSLFIDAIRDNKKILMNSPITIDSSYIESPAMVGYDFSESYQKKRIQDL